VENRAAWTVVDGARLGFRCGPRDVGDVGDVGDFGDFDDFDDARVPTYTAGAARPDGSTSHARFRHRP